MAGQGDEFVARVQREYVQRETQELQDTLARMPIAELRRHGPSGTRTKALEDDGLRSVADVVGWNADRFAVVPGIGPKTAPALEAATRAATASVMRQLEIALDDNPDNRTLLTALYRLQLWEQISVELSEDKVTAEPVPAQAHSAKILKSRIRWGLASPARRTEAVSALQSLARTLDSGVAERASSAMDQICEEPEPSRVLANVNEQPQRFYDTLVRLIPQAAVRPAAPRVPDYAAEVTSMDPGSGRAPSLVLEPSPTVTMADELTPLTVDLGDAAHIRALAATADTDAALRSEQLEGERHDGESVGTAPLPRAASLSAGAVVLPDPGIWSAREGVKPVDAASTTSVADVLAEIVLVEGPMHAELAYRRYVHASGGQRVGPALRRALDTAVSRLVDADRVRVIAEPGDPTITLYITGTEPVSVRALGDRRLQDVPKSEVRALMEKLGLDHGVDPAQIKRATLTAYGRTAMTRAAEDYLDFCVSYRRRAGSRRLTSCGRRAVLT